MELNGERIGHCHAACPLCDGPPAWLFSKRSSFSSISRSEMGTLLVRRQAAHRRLLRTRLSRLPALGDLLHHQLPRFLLVLD
ncbi:MAG: hypothetical protein M3O61_19180, partial [Gemmatimonadota bacterium]|nr:hypothetical protein [Gemmatimonadota bacterium]